MSEEEEIDLVALKENTCIVAKRQEDIIEDIKQMQAALGETQASVEEIVELFRDGKSVIKFMGAAGKFARWAALTLASIAALWASITHFDKP